MSTTTFPTRFERTLSRPILSTILAVLLVSAAAALAVLAFTGVDGEPSVPHAPRSDGSQMPTPEWLERYLAPGVSGGSDVSVPLPSRRPLNRGLY
jgi:hypothetical protein